MEYDLSPQSQECLVCGTSVLSRFKAQASDCKNKSLVNIVECKKCGFAWQYPLGRTAEQSVEFFESAYEGKGKTESDYFSPKRKRDIAKLEFGFIKTIPGDNKTLLDIGAGAGIFAEVAVENGWSVTAVDPALEVDMIKKNGLIKPIRGTIDQVPKNELFDIVTLWDVIEHTMNPIELIINAKKHVKKGGWLVIETGNYKSADRICGGKSHWMYQLDHRWYFSPESIKKLLTKAGFANFIFAEKVLRPGWANDITYAGPSRYLLLQSIVKTPTQLLNFLSKYFALIKAKKWEMSGVEIFAIAAQNNN